MPGMRERRYGRIVNIASNAAIRTGLPGTTFYAATKAEVLILTRRFAMELGPAGITVNAVAPGWIVTEMARAGRSDSEFAARVKMVSDRSMVGRPGQPEDIAAAVAYLAGPEAGFVTAQVLTVDGGRMDHRGGAIPALRYRSPCRYCLRRPAGCRCHPHQAFIATSQGSVQSPA